MAKVTYSPPPGDGSFPAHTEQFGYSFRAGEEVEVSNERDLKAFAGNRYFVVGDKELTPPPAVPPAADGTPKTIMTAEQAAKITEAGTKAAEDKKPRNVPPAYHKQAGGAAAWLAGYDAYTPPAADGAGQQ